MVPVELGVDYELPGGGAVALDDGCDAKQTVDEDRMAETELWEQSSKCKGLQTSIGCIHWVRLMPGYCWQMFLLKPRASKGRIFRANKYSI